LREKVPLKSGFKPAETAAAMCEFFPQRIIGMDDMFCYELLNTHWGDLRLRK
jgi:hypothetical protein